MSKVITAEYLADNNMLRLEEPLEGVRDHETVQVAVTPVTEHPIDSEPPWMAFRGILSGKDGEEMAAAIEEMFPPWND